MVIDDGGRDLPAWLFSNCNYNKKDVCFHNFKFNFVGEMPETNVGYRKFNWG